MSKTTIIVLAVAGIALVGLVLFFVLRRPSQTSVTADTVRTSESNVWDFFSGLARSAPGIIGAVDSLGDDGDGE